MDYWMGQRMAAAPGSAPIRLAATPSIPIAMAMAYSTEAKIPISHTTLTTLPPNPALTPMRLTAMAMESLMEVRSLRTEQIQQTPMISTTPLPQSMEPSWSILIPLLRTAPPTIKMGFSPTTPGTRSQPTLSHAPTPPSTPR